MSTALRLYEIADSLLAIEARISANDGEIDAGIEADLDALEMDLPEKTDAISALVRQADGEAAFFHEELIRLTARKRVAANRSAALKAYLLDNLAKLGRAEVKGRRFTVRLQKNSAPSIKWTRPIEDLPPGFARYEAHVDREAAQAAFKAGALPPGFEAGVGVHVRIS